LRSGAHAPLYFRKENEMKNRELAWRTASSSDSGFTGYSEILVKIKKDADLYAGKWVRVYSITEDRVLVEPPTDRNDTVEFARSDIEMIAFDLNDFPSLRAKSVTVTNDGMFEHWIASDRQILEVGGNDGE